MRIVTWTMAVVGMVAAAAALALVPATVDAAPKEPVPLADSYYLGGLGKLKVKKALSERVNVTWRIAIDGDAFAIHGVTEGPLTGTFERRGRTGKKLLLTFDPASLEALGSGLGNLVFSLGSPDWPPVQVTSVKAQVIVGKTPDRSRLKVKLGFDAELAEGEPASSGTFKLNGKGVSRRVIVLNDDRSAPQVLEALRRKRIQAFSVGYYEIWDGLDPPLSETDVVLFLQGYEYDAALTPEADQALVDFVDAGGLLVRTEWSAYEYGDGTGEDLLAIDDYLPVRAPLRDYLEGEVCTWTIQDGDHPLTKGLRPTFDIDGAGISFIEPIEGATVLATNQRDEPALTIASFGPGEVVHINNDLTYDVEIISDEILRLLVNCADYGLRR